MNDFGKFIAAAGRVERCRWRTLHGRGLPAGICGRTALERLESRMHLAVVTWDGGPSGTGTDFHLAQNWDSDTLPGPLDSVVIPDMPGTPEIAITQAVTVASLTTDEALRVSSATLTLAEASRFNSSFTLQGGTVSGSGDIAIAGPFAWLSGTMSGSGATTLEAGGTWTLSGSATRNLFRPLIVDRAFVFSSGTLTGAGQLTIRGEFQWLAGTMGGSGATVLEPGAEWVISSGSHTVDRPMYVDRDVAFSGGSLVGNGHISIVRTMTWSGGNDLGNGELRLLAGSTLDVVGAADRQLRRTLVNDGRVNIGGGNLSVGIVQNRGAITWTSGSIDVTLGSFVNDGVITVRGATDRSLTTNSNVPVINNGELIKEGAGVLSLSAPHDSSELMNAGSIRAIEGGLHIYGGGSNFGLISGAAGSTIRLQSSIVYYSGSLLQSAGTLTFSVGVYIFANGTLEVTGELNLTAGTVSINNVISPTQLGPIGATVTFHRPVDYAGAVAIVSDSTTFRHPQTFSSLTLSSGSLVLHGTTVVTQSFAWSGGGIRGDGELILQPGSSALVDGGNKSLDLVLTSAADMTWTAGNITMGGGTFINNATLVVDTATSAAFVRQGDTNLVRNNGKIIKRGTGSFEAISTGFGPSTFENNGQVTVETGDATLRSMINRGSVDGAPGSTLRLGNTLAYDPGSIVSTSGALRFEAGNHTFPAGTLAAAGSLRVLTGTITINNAIDASSISIGGGVLLLSHPHSLGTLEISGGSLVAAAGISVSGSFLWSGGEVAGAGAARIATGATMTISGSAAKTLNIDLIIDGGAAWTAGALQLNRSTYVNGSFTAAATTFLTATGAGDLVINGAFTKTGSGTLLLNSSGGAAVMEVRTSFAGVLSVAAGSMSINSSAVLSFDGLLTVAAGSQAVLDSVPVQLVTEELAGGNWTVGGTVTLPGDSEIRRIGAAAAVTLTGQGLIRQNGMNALARLGKVEGELQLTGGAHLLVDPDNRDGRLENAGSISVGVGGLLDIAGGYRQLASGALRLAVAGTASAELGRIVATGSAHLGGSVHIAFESDFSPERGSSFQLVSSSGTNGDFAATSVSVTLAAMLKSPVIVDSVGVRVVVTHVTDWNNDLVVNVQDVFGYLSSWFIGDGDFDGNGSNEVSDIFVYLSAWFAAM